MNAIKKIINKRHQQGLSLHLAIEEMQERISREATARQAGQGSAVHGHEPLFSPSFFAVPTHIEIAAVHV